MNRDVIPFCLGEGGVSQLVRLSLCLPGVGTKYEVMNPFVFVLQTIQKPPLKDAQSLKRLFTMNYWKAEKKSGRSHAHTHAPFLLYGWEPVAAVCHLWPLFEPLSGCKHEPRTCSSKTPWTGDKRPELNIWHNRYATLNQVKWVLLEFMSIVMFMSIVQFNTQEMPVSSQHKGV